MEPRQQKFAQKDKVGQLVTKTTILSILTTIKTIAGQNPANLMKFNLKNAKITFLHQSKKHIESSNNIFTEGIDFEAI